MKILNLISKGSLVILPLLMILKFIKDVPSEEDIRKDIEIVLRDCPAKN